MRILAKLRLFINDILQKKIYKRVADSLQQNNISNS
jgi:hypothetical protein